MRTFMGCALAFLLMGTPVAGQTPRLVTEVDTTTVSVGDRITYQVSVDHTPGSAVVWPDSLNLEPFEVLGGRAAAPVLQGDEARSSLVLTLAAFELGNLEIPSFEVRVITQEGDSITLFTNPYGIQVSSVGLDEGGDIRELKGPLGIAVSLVRVFLLFLGILLIFVVAYGVYRRMMRRRNPEFRGTSPALPYRPPHEIALEAFARLEASPLLERGEIKEFHIQGSEILRRYVEGRFQVPALEMTTDDITAGMTRSGVEPPVVEVFADFLHGCDMVKFAKYRPSAETAGALPDRGRKLVEETIPVTPRPVTEIQADTTAGTPTQPPDEAQPDTTAGTPTQPAALTSTPTQDETPSSDSPPEANPQEESP